MCQNCRVNASRASAHTYEQKMLKIKKISGSLKWKRCRKIEHKDCSKIDQKIQGVEIFESCCKDEIVWEL